MLITTIKNVIQVLKIFEINFQKMIIQKDFDIKKTLNKSKNSRNDQIFDSSKQEKLSNVVQMMILKSTFNKNV
jgi:hypothetical protein